MKLQSKDQRVHRFLARHAKKPSWGFAFLPDVRQAGKVEHPIGRVFNSIFLGLLTNKPTLRDVEEMAESLGFWTQKLVDKKVSDTTMDSELRRMEDEPLRKMLVQQVKEMHRAKCFKPAGLRKRHLRLKDDKGNWRTPPSWRITFTAVSNALVKNFTGSDAPVTSEQTV